jgi:ABC-2 type transport system permease protein
VKLRPGSSLWLLRHELRLFWFNSATGKENSAGRRQVRKRGLAIFGVLWLILHGAAFVVLRPLGQGGVALAPQLVAGMTALLVGLSLLMVSSGLKSSVEVLFDRGDLDLLLSSPLPSRSILAVRLTGIVVGIGATYLFFLAPFAHVGLLLGQFRWLGIYPTIIGLAAVAASAAILLTLALVRMVGARRTRVIAQVLGALAGALLFLLSQLYNFVSHGNEIEANKWLAQVLSVDGALAPDSAAWLPGRAALGEPLPLLGMSLLAAAVFILTVRFTHRFFVHGLQLAASTTRVAKAPPGGVRYQFNRSLAEVVVVKEWRLIARDPHLISQFSKPGIRTAGVATGLTLLCASLGSALTWIIVQAEDAPDLLNVSPANAGIIRLAKLAAAVMPPLLLVSVPLLWILAHEPLAGLLTSFTVTGAVIGAALIVTWSGRPGERNGFMRRRYKNMIGGLLELFNTLAWAGLAYLLITSLGSAPSEFELLGAGVLFAVTLVVPLFAWLGRRRDRV